MFLVTDCDTLTILDEYPDTAVGFRDAATFACICGQLPALHPSGVVIELRMPDNTIKQIVTITSVQE